MHGTVHVVELGVFCSVGFCVGFFLCWFLFFFLRGNPSGEKSKIIVMEQCP